MRTASCGAVRAPLDRARSGVVARRQSIAFAAGSRRRLRSLLVAATGGAPRRVTSSCRRRALARRGRPTVASCSRIAPRDQWDLCALIVAPQPDGRRVATGSLTDSAGRRTQPRVSPDGKLVAFVSDRDERRRRRRCLGDGARSGSAAGHRRVARAPATPASARLRCGAARQRPRAPTIVGAPPKPCSGASCVCAATSRRRCGRRTAAHRVLRGPQAGIDLGRRIAVPATAQTTPSSRAAMLASRHGGRPAWSPDGARSPSRHRPIPSRPTTAIRSATTARRRRCSRAAATAARRSVAVPAPRPPDEGERAADDDLRGARIALADARSIRSGGR